MVCMRMIHKQKHQPYTCIHTWWFAWECYKMLRELDFSSRDGGIGYIHTCIHAYTQTYMHTYIHLPLTRQRHHLHTCTHTYTQIQHADVNLNVWSHLWPNVVSVDVDFGDVCHCSTQFFDRCLELRCVRKSVNAYMYTWIHVCFRNYLNCNAELCCCMHKINEGAHIHSVHAHTLVCFSHSLKFWVWVWCYI